MKTYESASAWTAACMSALLLAATGAAQADPTNAPVKPDKTYTGTVITVDGQEHTLDVNGVFLSKKFNLGSECIYRLSDKREGTAGDLRPGEKVMVSYRDAHGVLVADCVEQVPMRYEGMVKAIDPVNHLMTVHAGVLNKKMTIAGDCRIVLRNDRPGQLADIQTGNHVTVTYETPGGSLTAREIAQTSRLFTGTLVALDLPEQTVKARGSFGTKKFNLANNCAIVVNGKPDGQLADLRPDDRLDFSYDEINGINVVNRIAPAAAVVTNAIVTSTPGMGY